MSTVSAVGGHHRLPAPHGIFGLGSHNPLSQASLHSHKPNPSPMIHPTDVKHFGLHGSFLDKGDAVPAYRQVDQLKAKLFHAEIQHSKLNETIVDLKLALDRADQTSKRSARRFQRQLRYATERSAMLRRTVMTLKDALRQKDVEASILSASLNSTTDLLDTAYAKNSALEVRLTASENDRVDLERSLDATEKMMEVIADELESKKEFGLSLTVKLEQERQKWEKETEIQSVQIASLHDAMRAQRLKGEERRLEMEALVEEMKMKIVGMEDGAIEAKRDAEGKQRELEAELKGIREVIKAGKEQEEALMGSLRLEEEKLAAVKEEMVGLEKARDEDAKAIAALEGALAALKEEKDALLLALDGARKGTNEAMKALDTANANHASVVTSLEDTVEDMRKTLQENRITHAVELSHANRRADLAEQNLVERLSLEEEKLAAVREEVVGLEKARDEDAKAIATLEGALAALKREKEALLVELDGAREGTSEAVKALDLANASHASMVARLEDTVEDIRETLQENRITHEVELSDANRRADLAEQELVERLSLEEEKLAAVREEVAGLKKVRDEDAIGFRKEIARLEDALEAFEKENETLLFELDDALEGTSEALKDLDTANASHASEVANFEKNLEEFGKMLEGNRITHAIEVADVKKMAVEAERDAEGKRMILTTELAELREKLNVKTEAEELAVRKLRIEEEALAMARQEMAYLVNVQAVGEEAHAKQITTLTQGLADSKAEKVAMEADFQVISEANARQVASLTQELADFKAEKAAMEADYEVITVTNARQIAAVTKELADSKAEKVAMEADFQVITEANARQIAALTQELANSKAEKVAMEADFKVIKEANAMQITTIMQKLADSEAEKGAMMADFQVIEGECHALTKASELTRTSHAADIMRLEQVSTDLAESFDHRTALMKKDAAFELDTAKESFKAERKIFFDQIAMLNNALEESSKTHEQAMNFHQLELLAATERAEASEVARDEVMMSHAIELDRMRKEIIKLTDENTSFMAKFNALSVDFNEERRKWEVEKLASSNKLADMRSEITGLLQAHNEEQKTSANLLATLSQEVKHREKEVAEIRKIIADKVLRLRTVLESTNLIDRNERATTRMATRMETIDRPNPSLQAKVTAPTSTGALVDKTVAENRNLFSAKNLINWPKNMQAHVPSAAEPLDGRNINLVAAAGTERSFKGVGSTSTFQRQPYGAAFIGRREPELERIGEGEGDRVTDLSESTNDAALNGDNKKPDIEFLEETTSATVIQNGQSTHEAAINGDAKRETNGVPIDVWESTTEAQWNIAKSSNQTFATAGAIGTYLNFADEMDEALLPVKIQGTTKKVSQNTKPAKILREPL